MIPLPLLNCIAYIDLNSPESYPASTFLFVTLRAYRRERERERERERDFCPSQGSQESGILAHGRVWTAPV
jgi:hypothetical protein